MVSFNGLGWVGQTDGGEYFVKHDCLTASLAKLDGYNKHVESAFKKNCF